MMAQFLAIKARYPDCLLFYRMGDFYELFFDDAVKAAEALDIALTKRGKHLGEDIPMCGVPVHSHESYLARLIRKGFKVAVAEQTEDPAEARKRGAKAVVARDVVRVVTPGTLTEDELLDARAHNYLAAVAEVRGASAVAWLDVSTGAFETQCVAPADLSAVLARLAPGEVLVAEDSDAGADAPRPLAGVLAEWRERTTPLPAARFRPDVSARRLRDVFKVAALDAFGGFSAPEIAAAGALVDYVELTQKGRLPRLSPPRRVPMGAVMEIDGATRRNLELTETLSGERKGSLLSVIDRTVTGAGARLLARRLAAPLTDPQAIARRLDAVQFLLDNAQAREDCRLRLRRCPDVERALARLTVGRGGPRDLAAVRDALAQGPALRALLLQDSLVGEGGLRPPWTRRRARSATTRPWSTG